VGEGGGLALRGTARPEDVEAVRALVASTGFFSAEEIAMAGDLVRERLAIGEASGYEFLFHEEAGRLAGYACFGPIPCAPGRFDLYWIAVREDRRGSGLGRRILAACEERIRRAGGVKIYVDTASRDQYRPTRAFYEGNGYAVEARLADFYSDGDDKVIYVKDLRAAP
jgi:ribosomal protein S18 acetylase RimI-like enzyme